MLFPIAVMMLAQAAVQPPMMESDKPVAYGPLEIACTGVGSAEDDPQWKAYPIRIEFANGAAQYLSGAHVTITAGGKTIADGVCWGPWLVVKGTPGTYHVSATISGSSTQPGSNFTVKEGAAQTRIILRFPDFAASQ